MPIIDFAPCQVCGCGSSSSNDLGVQTCCCAPPIPKTLKLTYFDFESTGAFGSEADLVTGLPNPVVLTYDPAATAANGGQPTWTSACFACADSLGNSGSPGSGFMNFWLYCRAPRRPGGACVWVLVINPQGDAFQTAADFVGCDPVDVLFSAVAAFPINGGAGGCSGSAGTLFAVFDAAGPNNSSFHLTE